MHPLFSLSKCAHSQLLCERDFFYFSGFAAVFRQSIFINEFVNRPKAISVRFSMNAGLLNPEKSLKFNELQRLLRDFNAPGYVAKSKLIFNDLFLYKIVIRNCPGE